MMLQTAQASGKPHTGPVIWSVCFEASWEDSPKNLAVPGLTGQVTCLRRLWALLEAVVVKRVTASGFGQKGSDACITEDLPRAEALPYSTQLSEASRKNCGDGRTASSSCRAEGSVSYSTQGRLGEEGL